MDTIFVIVLTENPSFFLTNFLIANKSKVLHGIPQEPDLGVVLEDDEDEEEEKDKPKVGVPQSTPQGSTVGGGILRWVGV